MLLELDYLATHLSLLYRPFSPGGEEAGGSGAEPLMPLPLLLPSLRWYGHSLAGHRGRLESYPIPQHLIHAPHK
jgi:hypothetical protein